MPNNGYQGKTWNAGEIITNTALNDIEHGIQDVVLIQNTKPTQDPNTYQNGAYNKIWVQPTINSVEVPTYEEFSTGLINLKSLAPMMAVDSQNTIQSGTNLDDITQVGTYCIPSKTVALSLSNCPASVGCTMLVYQELSTKITQVVFRLTAEAYNEQFIYIRRSLNPYPVTWDSWRKISVQSLSEYYSKRISILGDSLSTYGGSVSTSKNDDPRYADGTWTWRNNRIRYPQTNLLTNVEDMYWKIVMNYFDMTLGVNDSWAGALCSWDGITESTDKGADKHAASMTRIGHLGENGTPDIILVNVGTNDQGENVEIGTVNYESPENYTTLAQIEALPVDTFANAYRTMLIRLMWMYPSAKIICMTINYRKSTSLDRTDNYNEVIKEICDMLGVPLVDTRHSGISVFEMNTYYGDTTHYNSAGMKLIADLLIKSMLYQVGTGDGAGSSVSAELTGLKLATEGNLAGLAVNIGQYVKANGTKDVNAALRCTDFIKIPDGALGFKMYGKTGEVEFNPCVVIYDGSKTYFRRIEHSTSGVNVDSDGYLSFTFPTSSVISNYKYIRFNMSNNANDADKILFEFITISNAYLDASIDTKINNAIGYVGTYTGAFTSEHEIINTGIMLLANHSYKVYANSYRTGRWTVYGLGKESNYKYILPSDYERIFTNDATNRYLELHNLDDTLDDINVDVYDLGSIDDLIQQVPQLYRVAKNKGGDYTSVTQCFLALKDDPRPKIIEIWEGDYDIYQEYVDADVPVYTRDDPARDYFDHCVWVPENTHVIGKGVVRLKWMPDPAANPITVNQCRCVSPLNVAGNAVIENIELYCKNGRYCIHNDPLGKPQFVGAVQKYINVKCYKEANDVDSGGNAYGFAPTVGFGIDRAMHYSYENCSFFNTGNGRAFYGHSRSSVGGATITEAMSSQITMVDCIMDSGSYAKCVKLGNAGTQNVHIRVLFSGCYFSGDIDIENENGTTISPNEFDVTMVACNNPIVTIADPNNRYPVKRYNDIAKIQANIAELKSQKADVNVALGAYSTGTAFGTIASFANGAEKIPVKKLMVNINSIQTGTGIPALNNVRPIDGWTSTTITRSGKNLFNQSLMKDQEELNTIRLYAPPGTKLTMSSSAPAQAESGLAVYFCKVGEPMATNQNAVYSGKSITKTVSNDGYVQIYQKRISDEKSFQDYHFQIEIGTIATEYIPFVDLTSYTINFPSQIGKVYKGILDATNGILTVTHKYIEFDGETSGKSFTSFSTPSNSAYLSISDASTFGVAPSNWVDPTLMTEAGVLVSNMVSLDRNTQESTRPYFLAYIGEAGAFQPRIRFDTNDVSSLEAANNKLKEWYNANTPFAIIYPLKNPEIHYLNPVEVQSLLGQNIVFSNTGETSVTYCMPISILENRIAALSERLELWAETLQTYTDQVTGTVNMHYTDPIIPEEEIIIGQ